MTRSIAGASRARANRLRKTGHHAQLLRSLRQIVESQPSSSRGSLLASRPQAQLQITPIVVRFAKHRFTEELAMKQNEGSIDRVARVLLGIVLLSIFFFGPHTWLGLLGIVPLFTGIVGFCPLYAALHLHTLKKA